MVASLNEILVKNTLIRLGVTKAWYYLCRSDSYFLARKTGFGISPRSFVRPPYPLPRPRNPHQRRRFGSLVEPENVACNVRRTVGSRQPVLRRWRIAFGIRPAIHAEIGGLQVPWYYGCRFRPDDCEWSVVHNPRYLCTLNFAVSVNTPTPKR